jgi:hypothetical protein
MLFAHHTVFCSCPKSLVPHEFVFRTACPSVTAVHSPSVWRIPPVLRNEISRILPFIPLQFHCNFRNGELILPSTFWCADRKDYFNFEYYNNRTQTLPFTFKFAGFKENAKKYKNIWFRDSRVWNNLKTTQECKIIFLLFTDRALGSCTAIPRWKPRTKLYLCLKGLFRLSPVLA